MTGEVALRLGVIACTGIIAGFGGALLVARAARRGLGSLDIPDERRVHNQATARGGGVGIVVATTLVLPLAPWWSDGAHDVYLLAVLILAWAMPNAVVGLTDDNHPLSAKLKLGLQFGAATIAVALGLRFNVLHLAPLPAIELGLLAWPLSIFWLVWLANLFNFMDGMDGLAAMCGGVFFCVLATVSVTGGAPGLAILAAAIAGSLIGFGMLNRPPARVFMGDGGSLCVGAILGGMSILLTRTELAAIPLSVSLIVITPFAFDATYTLLRRVVLGEPLLKAHRQHLYQRLIGAGWKVSRVLFLYVGMTVMTGGMGVFFARASGLAQASIWLFLIGLCSALVMCTSAAENQS